MSYSVSGKEKENTCKDCLENSIDAQKRRKLCDNNDIGKFLYFKILDHFVRCNPH